MAASAMEPTKLKPALELPLPAVLPSQEALESNQRTVLALYDETAVRLLRYARSFGLNDETAEDVVQDAFVALFRHLCLGRPRHSLTGWLFRVTRNLSLKQRQRERGAPADLVTDLLLERLVDPARYARGACWPSTSAAGGCSPWCDALAPRDRQCVYLRSEGLSYRDIAATLRLSLGAVAKSLTRALGRLATADRR